jgi:hypothetical protein
MSWPIYSRYPRKRAFQTEYFDVCFHEQMLTGSDSLYTAMRLGGFLVLIGSFPTHFLQDCKHAQSLYNMRPPLN